MRPSYLTDTNHPIYDPGSMSASRKNSNMFAPGGPSYGAMPDMQLSKCPSQPVYKQFIGHPYSTNQPYLSNADKIKSSSNLNLYH